MQLPESIVKSDNVIGVKVKNNHDEDLGKIEEIMLDKYEGVVRYVVLSFGGFLGLGDKLFAVPWKALDYKKEDECFVLDIDKDTLKNAPGFDKDHWPNAEDPIWRENVFKFYRVKPYWPE